MSRAEILSVLLDIRKSPEGSVRHDNYLTWRDIISKAMGWTIEGFERRMEKANDALRANAR